MELEKKIYISWAFTENEFEKRDVNIQIFKEIKDKIAKCECYNRAVGRNSYKVYPKDGVTITDQQSLLIADDGNVCFGGKAWSKEVTGNSDQSNYIDVEIYTD